MKACIRRNAPISVSCCIHQILLTPWYVCNIAEIAAQRMKMDSRYLDEVLYDDYYDAEFEEDVVEIVF